MCRVAIILTIPYHIQYKELHTFFKLLKVLCFSFRNELLSSSHLIWASLVLHPLSGFTF